MHTISSYMQYLADAVKELKYETDKPPKASKFYLKLECFCSWPRVLKHFGCTVHSDLWPDCQTNFASLWAWQTALVTKRWTAPANKCQAAR